MRRIAVGGHALAIDEHGEGEIAFVCLHGLADGRAVWNGIAKGLAPHGRIVTVDQRGHGDSDSPTGPYRREDLAADVAALLDRLDLDRAVLVGHSMGGIVAMEATVAFPDRVAGLVLIGTASQCNERAAKWYEEIALAAERDGRDGIRRAIFGASSVREIHGDPTALAHVTRCLESLFHDPLTPRLVDLRCPALLLVGSRDPMGAAASAIIARTIPGATLEVLPDHGHWPHVEAPDLVIGAIGRFLERERARLGQSAPRRV